MSEKPNNNKKLLSVKVDAEYATEVKNFAHKHYMNISDLLRVAIEEYMNRSELEETSK